MKAKQIIARVLAEGRKFLLEPEAKQICEDYGIPTTEFVVVEDLDRALEAASKLGYPVVLKIVSVDVLHKTEAGGVILDVGDANELKQAYRCLLENVKRFKPDARIQGVLVQEMAPQSVEVIIGCKRDAQFGLTLMFGLGGIYTEVLRDVSYRVVGPFFKRRDAEQMMRETRCYEILKGYRGKSYDVRVLVEILLRTSKLATDLPIAELDLNPIFVYQKGAKVIDARIILA
jgi:acetyl-CoA synthetase (ADP-forming)